MADHPPATIHYADLTKWPLLLVAGDPVTEEQANEILVRTSTWGGFSNDRAWTRQVCALAGIAVDQHGHSDWQSVDAFRASIGGLELAYLGNARISSSYIGGPHGWCDWDGRIGCSNYNIGKWPSVEEVHDDWARIAAAFPYLDLRAQLVPEESNFPVVEWVIRDGVAHLVEPVALLDTRAEMSDAQIVARFLTPGVERGVSLDRLRIALEQVREPSR